MTTRLLREPTVEEIATEMDVELSEVVIALEAIVEPVSIYLPEVAADENTLKTMIDKISRYAEMKDGDAAELLKYYLKKYKVNHQKELTQPQAEEIIQTLNNMIRRVDNETNK